MSEARTATAMAFRCLLSASAIACTAGPAWGHSPDEGLPRLEYVPAPPGTYELHRIMPAPDGPVLNVDGRAQKLSRFTQGKVTLLGFIYTTCTDPDGCPLAYRVFDTLKEQIHASPALQGKVRFVTLSFDPARDSPS
jgi:cytochrome oxidase Cu insertion factor (SCO1/SenC/PrrC family)